MLKCKLFNYVEYKLADDFVVIEAVSYLMFSLYATCNSFARTFT